MQLALVPQQIKHEDSKTLKEAIRRKQIELSNLERETGGDEAARLRKIVSLRAVIRAFDRMLYQAQKRKES